MPNLSFHPSQGHSRAGVDAGAKGEVSIWVPPDVETIRFRELSWITVCGPESSLPDSEAINPYAMFPSVTLPTPAFLFGSVENAWAALSSNQGSGSLAGGAAVNPGNPASDDQLGEPA